MRYTVNNEEKSYTGHTRNDLCEVNLSMDPSAVESHIGSDEPDEVNGD